MDLQKQELESLVSRAEYDSEAFGRLYDIFFPKIYSYIYHRVNDQQTAEDLVSEIFFKALKKLSSCRNKQEFQGWIFSIARNSLIDFYRKKDKAKETALTDNITETPGENFNPELAAVMKDNQQEVRKALQNLSPLQQEVIILRFVEELKLKEIARVLEKTEGAVKGLLYRGLSALSSELEKRGVSP